MSTTSISPNMNIAVPVPGVETGPQWATDLYNALYTIIDQHDHSSGKGVALGSSSFTPTSAFSMNGYGISNDAYLTFSPQASIATATTLYAKTAASGSGIYDLYFNDGAGNVIAITTNGSVNAGAGSITGMGASQSVVYSGGAYTFYSAALTTANVGMTDLLLHNSGASSNYYKIQAPAGMATNYTISLPVIPAATGILQMSTGGAVTATLAVDGTTLANSGTVLSVATGGIGTTQLASSAVTTAKIADSNVTTAKIADSNVTTAKIADANVTRAKLASLGQQVSARCNFTTTSSALVDVTGMTVTITSTGRPVMLMIQPAATFVGGIQCTGPASITIAILRDSDGAVAEFSYNGLTNGFNQANILSMLYLDTTATAATHTYKVQISSSDGSSVVGLSNATIVAYEMA